MFGVGLAEIAVLLVVGILVFGPERLPEFASQAARLLRQVRQLNDAAREQVREELGPELADLTLDDLDPRKAVRKFVEEAWQDPTAP